MAYRSKIKLEIGEVPKTKDPATLPDWIDVYNSIHILAQHVNAIQDEVDPDITPDTPPYIVQPFKTFFYGRIHQTVSIGNVLSCYGQIGSYGPGWYLGAPSGPIMPSNGNVRNGFVAVALEDGEPGDDIKIGIGPAILRVEGVATGQAIFAQRAFTPASFSNPGSPVGNGNIYVVNLNDSVESYTPNLSYVVIGACIGIESVYIYDHVDYWATQAATALIE